MVEKSERYIGYSIMIDLENRNMKYDETTTTTNNNSIKLYVYYLQNLSLVIFLTTANYKYTWSHQFLRDPSLNACKRKFVDSNLYRPNFSQFSVGFFGTSINNGWILFKRLLLREGATPSVYIIFAAVTNTISRQPF